MKKILFLMAMLPMILFTACSSDPDNGGTDDTDDNDTPSINGVWENGNHFVSFGSDGFYAAHIADEFIDSGNYTQSKNDVSCENAYFNRNTSYTIKSASDKELMVDVTYTDLNGKSNNKTMTFSKSTATPASQNHSLNGKSYIWYTSTFGNVTMTFNTYNSGIKSAAAGNAAKYPLKFFYIYVGEKLYHQILSDNSIQVPTIGSWSTNYNIVRCWKLSFNPNGSISGHDVIE